MFTHINRSIDRLDKCDIENFIDANKSYVNFLTKISIDAFRKLDHCEFTFDHPITVISGTNTVGKTSILLLVACSHENFKKLDSSKPEPTWRPHAWKDVIAFTKNETDDKEYSYSLHWRVGNKKNVGTGKRLVSSKAWSGLGKRAKDVRTNAKIRDREVRLIDLERILPARSFSRSLLRKSLGGKESKLDSHIAEAFCYILQIPFDGTFQIFEAGGHVNKRCYLIVNGGRSHSSYNAATGEESLINLLRDVLESPDGSLILIDELEAGFHPEVQRRLAKVLMQVSWTHKKQFIITTHSSTLLSAFPRKSRKFIECNDGIYRVISGISPQVALSKMDSVGHPLVRVYCEDGLAKFLINKVIMRLAKRHPSIAKVLEVVESGPASSVKTDYERHIFHYKNVINNMGCCAIIDGDFANDPDYKKLKDDGEDVAFIYPNLPPEKFLVDSYLEKNPNLSLQVFRGADDHHALFKKMVELGLAADLSDARNVCYQEFESSPHYTQHIEEISQVLKRAIIRYSDEP